MKTNAIKKSNLSCACNQWKTRNLSAVNFKKHVTTMGRHLSPRYSHVILVRGYFVLTGVN